MAKWVVIWCVLILGSRLITAIAVSDGMSAKREDDTYIGSNWRSVTMNTATNSTASMHGAHSPMPTCSITKETAATETSATNATSGSASCPSTPLEQLMDQSNGGSDGLQIIFTVDPNFVGCFEAVPINDFTRHTVFAYIKELKDVLTRTPDNPLGDNLLIATEHVENDETTYKQRIDAALTAFDNRTAAGAHWEDHVMLPSMMLAAYQMTQIPTNEETAKDDNCNKTVKSPTVHFTTATSFWHTAETTAGTGSLVNSKANATSRQWDAFNINSIAGSVIFLPRWTPLVHSTEDDAYTVTGRFGVPARDWNPATLQNIVSTFVNISQVKTEPELSEWAANADKTQLQYAYQAHYDAAPDSRTPPVETAHVKVPQTAEVARQHCWNEGAKPPSEVDIQNTMKEIFEGLQRLHSLAPLESKGRLLAESPDPAAGGTPYVLKRDYAEAAYGMTKFRFPDHLLQAPHEFKPWLARNEVFNASQLEEGSKKNGTFAPQLLRAAATHMIKVACGLPWLLQFKIALFELSEYRVYLLGGADAKDEDIHIVYTPAYFHNGRLAMRFSTLKPGHVIHALLPPCENDTCINPNAQDAAHELPPTQPGSLQTLWWTEWYYGQRPLPHIYDMLVSAARDGAKALRLRQTAYGQLLRSVNDAFVRVDVLLALPWNTSSNRRQVVTRINEMDWINSAALMISVWENTPAAREAAENICGTVAPTEPEAPPGDDVLPEKAQKARSRRLDPHSEEKTLDRVAPSYQNGPLSAMAASLYNGTASGLEDCSALSAEQLRAAMQLVQGRSPGFRLARAMLQRANVLNAAS